MPPDPAKGLHGRRCGGEPARLLFPPDERGNRPEDKVPGEEEKKPRQQREIVGRVKPVRREAEIGGQVVLVKRFRHSPQPDPLEAEAAAGKVPGEEKEEIGRASSREKVKILEQYDT